MRGNAHGVLVAGLHRMVPMRLQYALHLMQNAGGLERETVPAFDATQVLDRGTAHARLAQKLPVSPATAHRCSATALTRRVNSASSGKPGSS
ncbi:hypothetical protein XAP6164_3640002 [Xanthomonas phaseoli pv. phaseoli]|nr:hypothetical protein XAP6164_3640002 [Xanthomonas phaseoli pv. phaseoli]